MIARILGPVLNKLIRNQFKPSLVTYRSFNIVPMDQPAVTKSKVLVRKVEGETTLKITFTLSINNHQVLFNLNRDREETLDTCFIRLKNNIEKRSNKAKKTHAKTPQPSDVDLNVLCGDKVLDPVSTKNNQAWVDGNALLVEDKKLIICVNEPQVKITLPKNIMAGFCVIPKINLEFCTFQDCKYAWYRQVYKNDDIQSEYHHDGKTKWMKMSDSFVYHPSITDLGRLLKFCCLPISGNRVGFQEEYISQPVELGPGICPFEKRHEYTKHNCDNPGEFRIMSYNILADLYADSDYSRETLFRYCPNYALNIDYRKQLLLMELIGYNADIICLQEVDSKVFHNDLQPSLCLVDGLYEGIYSSKGGQVAEGVAIFYRSTKFELIDSCTIELNRLVDPKDSQQNAGQKSSLPRTDTFGKCIPSLLIIKQAIEANPNLAKRFFERHTVVQVTLLRNKSDANHLLLIANTHLYFHPDADHIRLLQGSIIVKYLEFLKDFILENSNKFVDQVHNLEVAEIFCGDLNSTPDCGLYRLVTIGDVPDTLRDWNSNEDEAVTGLNLTTKLRLESAYGTPDYTNYTVDFNGCLDYIYYCQDKLERKKIVPMPDHADVIKHEAIPSITFPSDHIALVADLSWNQ